jgi:hypothetical protein
MRKPVQIATTSVDHRETVALFALCDDGSMWVAEANKQNEKWIRLSDIPQGEPKQPAASPDVVAALRELEQATSQYRFEVGLGQNGRTAFPWERMLQARNAAREVLKRVNEQEGQR